MKPLKQQGYALIIVLLIITIIGLLAPPLINSVLNSSLQAQKAEENIQTEKLIDMGKTYSRNNILKIVEEQSQKRSTDEMIVYLEQNLENKEQTLDFEIEQIEADFSIKYTDVSRSGEDSNEINIHYTVKGTIDNSKWDEESEIFTITKMNPVEIGDDFIDFEDIKEYQKFTDNYSGGNVKFVDKLTISKGERITVNGNAVLLNEAHLKNDSNLSVKGDFYAENATIHINNPGAEMLIDGNATFNNITIKNSNSNNPSFICVKGNIKLIGSNHPDFEKVESCSREILGNGNYYVGNVHDEAPKDVSSFWKPVGTSS